MAAPADRRAASARQRRGAGRRGRLGAGSLLGLARCPARASGIAVGARPVDVCGRDRARRGDADGRHAGRAARRARAGRRAQRGELRRARDAGGVRGGHRARRLGRGAGGGRVARGRLVLPGEVLEDRAGDIAVGFASLLTRQAAWRHRCVETITVLSHELVRRSVSVDFTVPAEYRDDLRLSEREWVVPLALLAKRPLAHFDLRMEDMASVPLLRSEETQLVGRELLYLMLDLDLSDDAADARADRLIERVLATNGDDLDAIDTGLSELEERVGAVPGFVALAGRLPRRRPPC